MSMILDALTRAEHERQLEKQPDLKFVTPVKPQKNNPNKVWLYIGLGVLVNALILYLVIRALSADWGNEIEVASTSVDAPLVQQQNYQQPPSSQPLVQDTAQVPRVEIPVSKQRSQSQQVQNVISQEARPLAMEAHSEQVAEIDRPLVYESKPAKAKPTLSTPEPIVEANAASAKGNVSFSSKELNVHESTPIINKPKLLIEGVDKQSASNVPNVRDLPESSRSSLSQYEINVHVFDDDPIRRFVLINMDKYKEGDRIVNNGPIVEEITPAGVVVDYGSGRALLPSK